MPALPTLTEIESAAALLRPHLPPTPCYRWPLLEEMAGCEIWMKHENHTPVGAFKVRGGMVYLDELLKTNPGTSGIIAASTGNHGQSIAWNAKRRGVRAIIVVPQGNNPEKNAAMRAYGAELVEHGREFQEALEYSGHLAVKEGLHAVPSFHPWLVRGVATYALEMFREAPPLDALYVPVGLGSGFCGVAAVREAMNLGTKIIGVVSAQAPAYALSFQQRRLITHTSATQVAEGVACSTPNSLALEWILEHAHNIVTVSDAEALTAMCELLQATHNLAEGSGAIAFAAIKKDQQALKGQRVGCVLSGGNVNLAVLERALRA